MVKFSVSSAYHMTIELKKMDRAESSTQRGESKLWYGIWALDVPNAWKILGGGVAIIYSLQKRIW